MPEERELTEEEYKRLLERSEPLIDTMRKRKPRPKTEGKNQ